MRVKIVLRDKESGLYYRSHAQWAKNAYDALTFKNVLEAEDFARAHNLADFQFIQQSGYFHRPLQYDSQKGVPLVEPVPAEGIRTRH